LAFDLALLHRYPRRRQSRRWRRPNAGDAEPGSEAWMPSQRRWAMDGPSARPGGASPE
jgi:hypothetical protein